MTSIQQGPRGNNNSPYLWRARGADGVGASRGGGLGSRAFTPVASFGGNVIVCWLLENRGKCKTGGQGRGSWGRRQRWAPSGQRAAAPCSAPPFLWPLIPAPRPAAAPGEPAAVIGGAPGRAVDDCGVLISRKHRGCRGHLGVIIPARRDRRIPSTCNGGRHKSGPRRGPSRLGKMNGRSGNFITRPAASGRWRAGGRAASRLSTGSQIF